jgi:hypothetical protein
MTILLPRNKAATALHVNWVAALEADEDNTDNKIHRYIYLIN